MPDAVPAFDEYPKGAEELVPLIYAELKRLASARLLREKPGYTLSATALVHEVYLRLVATNAERRWNSRGHFFAAAAEAMRRILVDRARHRKTLKQGGNLQRQDLELDTLCLPEVTEDVLAIDSALEKLNREHPLVARLVELRYFAGLSHEETAGVLGISIRTAHRHWNYAKAWLHAEIKGRLAP